MLKISNDSQYKVSGAKVGDTVKARLPQQYLVNKGAAISPTPTENRTVDIVLTDQANVAIEFSMQSLTLDIDNYRERYIDPAVEALAATCDQDGMTRMYKKVHKATGTPGVIPGSSGTLPSACNLVYQGAVTKLANGAVPPPYCAMLSPEMQQYFSSANHTVFNPQMTISKLFTAGQFGGEMLGIQKWFQTQSVPAHTVGPLGGTPLVNGASQTGGSIITDGWTAAAANRLKAGDVIQLAGVNEANPQTKLSVGQLMDFVVDVDEDSDGSGNITINISPNLEASGNYQNVTGSPADDAVLTIFGHASNYASVETPQGLVYNKDAFALVMADLEMPGNLWVAERIQNKALGIAVRFLKDYSIMTDQSPARLDILYGWAAIRPEMACRVAA